MITYKLMDDYDPILTIQAESREHAKEQLENLASVFKQYDTWFEVTGEALCWTLHIYSYESSQEKTLQLIEQ